MARHLREDDTVASASQGCKQEQAFRLHYNVLFDRHWKCEFCFRHICPVVVVLDMVISA